MASRVLQRGMIKCASCGWRTFNLAYGDVRWPLWIPFACCEDDVSSDKLLCTLITWMQNDLHQPCLVHHMALPNCLMLKADP